MPVAVFGMGPRTLEKHDLKASREQLLMALAKVPEVDPVEVAVFGGVIEPHALRSTACPPGDARDWSAIRAWASDVAGVFAYGKAASEARDHRSELQQSPR